MFLDAETPKILQKPDKFQFSSNIALCSWHNFITLQVEMKKVCTKIFAALLVVWYLVGIIGFDMHTCNGSGRSFVVAFFEGMSCEDIHPEHVCDEASCCAVEHETCCCDHHHDSECSVSSKSCCSNDYLSLELAGTISQDDHRHYDECACGNCPCAVLHSAGTDLFAGNLTVKSYIWQLGSGVPVACDMQAVFGVWRI